MLSSLAEMGFDVVAMVVHLALNLRSASRAYRASSGRSRLIVAATLSSNRNFEARIHPQVKMNFHVAAFSGAMP